MWSLKKNKELNFNQLRVKLLYKSNFFEIKLKSVYCNLNLLHLKSQDNDFILENLFLLEYFSFNKASILSYNKSYQELLVRLSTVLRKYVIYNFFFILNNFYFPVLKRRNLIFSLKHVKLNNFYYKIEDINIFPFVPNIFFDHNIPISYFLNLSSRNKLDNILYLSYLGIPFNKI